MVSKDKACLRVQSLTDFLYSSFQGAPKGIIFDCDGVLIDSVEANMKYYNLLRVGLGLPELNEEQREYCQMSTATQAFEYIVPASLRPLIPEVMKGVSYEADIAPFISVSEDLIPLLQRYKPYFKMGVHTNRLSNIDKMLNKLGLGNIFEPVITIENAEAKPSPDGTLQILKEWNMNASEVLFIGDSQADRGTALAAGVPFLSYRNPSLQSMGTCCDFKDLSAAFSLLLDLGAELNS